VVLVGAVGIENNDVRNFKELRGIRGNAKSLKKNKRARKGVLIAPSKLPRLSPFYEDSIGFGLKFSGTDGKPTLHPEDQQILFAA
jgi:hypothetical protein